MKKGYGGLDGGKSVAVSMEGHTEKWERKGDERRDKKLMFEIQIKKCLRYSLMSFLLYQSLLRSL